MRIREVVALVPSYFCVFTLTLTSQNFIFEIERIMSYFFSDVMLIEAVRGNKCLYDFQDGQYKNMLYKEKIWKSIGESLNVDAEICKKRWRNLRDTHKRICRKRYAASESAASVPAKNWKYAEHMSFLENVQQHRSTICSMPVEAAFEKEDPEDSDYPAPSPPSVPSSPPLPFAQHFFTPLSVTPETTSPTPSGSNGLPTRWNRLMKNDAMEEFMKATLDSVSTLTATVAGRMETKMPVFQRHLSLLGQEVVDANVPVAVQHSLLRDVQELIYKTIEPYQ